MDQQSCQCSNCSSVAATFANSLQKLELDRLMLWKGLTTVPVSYTHLTLPTILRV